MALGLGTKRSILVASWTSRGVSLPVRSTMYLRFVLGQRRARATGLVRTSILRSSRQGKILARLNVVICQRAGGLSLLSPSADILQNHARWTNRAVLLDRDGLSRGLARDRSPRLFVFPNGWSGE